MPLATEIPGPARRSSGGIRNRFLAAFMAVILLSALAWAGSFWAVGEVTEVLARVTERQMPTALTSLSLSRRVERLVNTGPALLAETNETGLARLETRVESEVEEMLAEVDRLRAGADVDALESIEREVGTLRENLDRLRLAASRRLTLGERKATLMARVFNANDRLSQLLGPWTQVSDERFEKFLDERYGVRGTDAVDLDSLSRLTHSVQILARINEESTRVADRLLRISTAPDLDRLEALSLQALQALDSARVLGKDMPIRFTKSFNAVLDTWERLLADPRGLGATRKGELELTMLADGLIFANDRESRRLAASVDGLVERIRERIEAERLSAADSHRWALWTLAGTVLVLLGTAFFIIFRWIERRLLRSLDALGNDMRALASGNLESEIIGRRRSDEIGELARALEVFRDQMMQRRRLEGEMIALNENLEREVRDRTQDLARETDLLETTLANMTDGLTVVDLQGNLLLWNRQFFDLFDLPRDFRSAGLPFTRVIEWVASRDMPENPDAGRLAAERFSALRADEPFEFEHRTFDGRVIALRSHPMPGGGHVTAYQDVTPLRQREAELELSRDQAEAGARAKAEFLATMSHEIRTPLNGVLGMLQLLDRTSLTTEQADCVVGIRDSAETLLTTIDDILDFSKIEAGRLELEVIDFDPARAARSVVEMFSARAAEKGLVLTTEIAEDLPAAVKGDPARLRQVLLNFVSNALKFTDVGGITVRALASAPNLLRFEVKDTGIGISGQAVSGLFQEFSQADSSITRRYGGSGLGLAICKRLAEAMNGEVGVESEPGSGSTFWFQAPFAPGVVREPTPERAAEMRATLGRLRILLVEDTAVNRQVAERLLRAEGHTVTSAENGRVALEILGRGGLFDVVLMDIHMPEMDGMETTRRMRAMGRPVSRIPVIAMTASVTSDDLELYVDAGMDDVVAKPFTLENLEISMARVLRPVGMEADGVAPAGMTRAEPEQEPEPVKEPEKTAEPTLDDVVLVNPRNTGQLAGKLGPAFVAKLSRDYRKTVDTTRVDLWAAWDARDLATAGPLAHKIKGASQMLGLERVARLCAQLEERARADDPDAWEVLMESFDAVLDATLDALDGRVAELEAEAPVEA